MKTKAKCKKCGGEVEIDTSLVLTSNPPKYNGECKECNAKDCFLAEEIFHMPEKLSELPRKYGDCEDYGINNGLGSTKDNSVKHIPSPEHYNWMKTNQCNHVIDIKCTSGSFVTYCIKCGKIFDTKNCSFDYTTTYSGGLK